MIKRRALKMAKELEFPKAQMEQSFNFGCNNLKLNK